MRDLDVRLPRRTTGRPALEKRMRLLLVAIVRFGRFRAFSSKDQAWCARVGDELTALLRADPEGDR